MGRGGDMSPPRLLMRRDTGSLFKESIKMGEKEGCVVVCFCVDKVRRNFVIPSVADDTHGAARGALCLLRRSAATNKGKFIRKSSNSISVYGFGTSARR